MQQIRSLWLSRPGPIQSKMLQPTGTITLLCLCVVAAAVSAAEFNHRPSRRADFEAAKSLFPRQGADCEEIETQLVPIFNPCINSLRQCLQRTQPATLAVILCDPESGLIPWAQLVICRGQEFGDDVWTTTCSEVDGSKCYELMQRHQDLVDDTFVECCGAQACSNTCKSGLQSVVNKLQCCVNTLPLKLLFQGCNLTDTSNLGSASNNDASELEVAFSSCDVEFPDHCEYLFSDVTATDVDLGSACVSTSTASVIAASLMLVFIVVFC